MQFRLANIDDLSELKAMYRKTVAKMNDSGIDIWDDIYPSEFLEDDIKNNSLYIMKNEQNIIIGAFALSDTNSGESFIKWEKPEAKALYIDRFTVNAEYGRCGFGTLLIDCAINEAKAKKAEYLRLFAVDTNKPAIKFYLNNNFTQAQGVFIEEIEDDLKFTEYGFEIKL